MKWTFLLHLPLSLISEFAFTSYHCKPSREDFGNLRTGEFSLISLKSLWIKLKKWPAEETLNEETKHPKHDKVKNALAWSYLLHPIFKLYNPFSFVKFGGLVLFSMPSIYQNIFINKIIIITHFYHQLLLILKLPYYIQTLFANMLPCC